MSVAWLTSSHFTPSDIRDLTPVAVIEVADHDLEALAVTLAGYEIIVTSGVALGEILRRCRWIRGVIGVGPDAHILLDWSNAERRGLLVTLIEADGRVAIDHVRTALTNMNRQLRSLDEIAEGWEGT